MYPRASYPERPIDSRVLVARSNSWSRSTPPASSFDKSCGTTGPRYSRPVFIFSNGGVGVGLRNAEQAFIRREPSFAFMGSARPAVLAVVAFLLVFWSVFAPAVGQNPVGHMVVTTDYELFGTSDLAGGRLVPWSWGGAEAADLRAQILLLFDEYGQIARRFSFEGAATSANGNQVLDAAEGANYTDQVENVLEGLTGQATPVQYMRLGPFDLRQKNADPAVGFSQSTSGLANTNLSTSADVEIRMLFEANTTTRNARVFLPTELLADSLYRVFWYDAAQSPNLNASGLYPAWPFLVEGGWNIVPAPGCPAGVSSPCQALWAVNPATGMYDNNIVAATNTTADPIRAISSDFYKPFDLRFASQAWVTFNYTGQVADARDRLRLQIAHAPAFTDWTNLLFGSTPDLPQTAPGIWTNATVNLTGYLGDRVRLRLNFTSDATGSARGFYIRDFALHAPSLYEGEVVQADTHYLVGPLSFSSPVVRSGSLQVIRTPGGEILSYTSTRNASSIPNDTIRYAAFDIFDNPQVLFAVMLVASYAISRFQHGAYLRYRASHSAAYRPAVHKAKWLHRLGALAIALLVLFYFVPTATWILGVRVFVSGLEYWLFAITLTLVLGFGTRAYYSGKVERAASVESEEEQVVVKKVAIPTGPPEAGAVLGTCLHCQREILGTDPTYRCTCGAMYHLSCAASLTQCPNCRTPITVEADRTTTDVSMRCESCGEVQTVPQGTDPRVAPCSNCSEFLRHLDEGKRYLVVASNPAIGFAWLRDLTKLGRPAICMTSAAVERMRLEFGVKDVPIVQVSSHGADAIDPKNLDPVGLRSILQVTRERRGGVILYDGLDQIISESSVGDIIGFLRKANDMAFVHGVTVIARISPGVLADEGLKRLNAEFDEYLDLSAQL